ncbi:proton channel OtopLc-like isoform X2 [Babylonia areolata]
MPSNSKPAEEAFALKSKSSPDMTSPDPEADSEDTSAGFLPGPLRENLLIIMSGQYGLLIVVVGAVLPVVETFANPNSYMFEGFYIYLYLVSTIFMVYVYAYLLRRQTAFLPGFKRAYFSFRRNISGSTFSRQSSTKSDPSGLPTNGGATGKHRRRKVAYNEKPNSHTGSFYLRVGAVGFGVGSMIHSGLTFGHYIEIVHLGNACGGAIQAVKPFLHLLFTFIQMYFIFMNSKMCINHHKTFARFGLMHMAATNVCVWLRAIVVQTLHEIQIANRNSTTSQPLLTSPGVSNVTARQAMSERFRAEAVKGLLPELTCKWDALMGRVLESSGSYLYPCIIEYSLICASVLYVMWSQVGHDPRRQKQQLRHVDSVAESIADAGDDAEDEHLTALQRMSVDCSGSQRGLFMGLFVFVGGVVMLVTFYVLASSPMSLTSASVVSHVSESLIYVFCLAATFVSSWRMRKMRFSRERSVSVEQTLAIISLTGLIAFAMFNIVAAVFSTAGSAMAVTLLSNILMLLQGCGQALFMLAAMRVSPASMADVRRKPGRQWVTFLLVSNFALWCINTFETQRLEHNLLQVEFYGSTAWNIFCHVSVPLGIYYRFHSTVCLSNIWKNAWKSRRARQV